MNYNIKQIKQRAIMKNYRKKEMKNKNYETKTTYFNDIDNF